MCNCMYLQTFEWDWMCLHLLRPILECTQSCTESIWMIFNHIQHATIHLILITWLHLGILGCTQFLDLIEFMQAYLSCLWDVQQYIGVFIVLNVSPYLWGDLHVSSRYIAELKFNGVCLMVFNHILMHGSWICVLHLGTHRYTHVYILTFKHAGVASVLSNCWAYSNTVRSHVFFWNSLEHMRVSRDMNQKVESTLK